MFELLCSLFIGVVVYNIPSIIAVCRHHPKALQILIVNILFGWTIIGWIIALVWSGVSICEEDKIKYDWK